MNNQLKTLNPSNSRTADGSNPGFSISPPSAKSNLKSFEGIELSDSGLSDHYKYSFMFCFLVSDEPPEYFLISFFSTQTILTITTTALLLTVKGAKAMPQVKNHWVGVIGLLLAILSIVINFKVKDHIRNLCNKIVDRKNTELINLGLFVAFFMIIVMSSFTGFLFCHLIHIVIHGVYISCFTSRRFSGFIFLFSFLLTLTSVAIFLLFLSIVGQIPLLRLALKARDNAGYIKKSINTA